MAHEANGQQPRHTDGPEWFEDGPDTNIIYTIAPPKYSPDTCIL